MIAVSGISACTIRVDQYITCPKLLSKIITANINTLGTQSIYAGDCTVASIVAYCRGRILLIAHQTKAGRSNKPSQMYNIISDGCRSDE